MKTAVVIAAHDGLVSQVTGVGVVVNSFVEAFGEIKSRSGFLRNNDAELICLSPYLKETSPDFNPRIKEITQSACASTKGKLVKIPTFAEGDTQKNIWDGPSELNCYTQWRGTSLSAASYLQSLKGKYGKIILFAHDTIFSSIRKYCPLIDSLRMIWVPHSLGRVFEDRFSEVERLRIEEDAIKAIVKSHKDFIGCIGNYFRERLQTGYNVPANILLTLTNGLYKNSKRYVDSIPETKLEEYNIPLEKKLIFSWGRCVAQKGYDLLIPAYKQFTKNHPDFHLVLLMPTQTSEKSYLKTIQNGIDSLPSGSVTAIYQFDELFPKSILSFNNLEMILLPSRFEGAPITALEALTFASKKTKIVYSPIPPFREVLEEDPRSIEMKQLNPGSIFDAMEEAYSKPIPRKLSIKDYNFVSIYSYAFDLIGGLKNVSHAS